MDLPQVDETVIRIVAAPQFLVHKHEMIRGVLKCHRTLKGDPGVGFALMVVGTCNNSSQGAEVMDMLQKFNNLAATLSGVERVEGKL